MLEAWLWNQERELELRHIIAWKTAAWSRAKKVPSLSSVLKKLKPKKKPKKVDPGEARRIGQQAIDRLKEIGREDILRSGPPAPE